MDSTWKADPHRVVRCGAACMLIQFLISLAARSIVKDACNDGKWSGVHSRGAFSGGRPQGAEGQGGGCAAHAGDARKGAGAAGRTSECAPACAGVQHFSRGATEVKAMLSSVPMHILCLYRYPSAPTVQPTVHLLCSSPPTCIAARDACNRGAHVQTSQDAICTVRKATDVQRQTPLHFTVFSSPVPQ